MLTVTVKRRGQSWVSRDGNYLGAWIGEHSDIKALVELANEDEERALALNYALPFPEPSEVHQESALVKDDRPEEEEVEAG